MIEVNNLVKYFDSFKALDGISFRIPRGEIVGLLGPNGAGKSSTIRILCGYLSPTAGTVTIGGLNVGQNMTEVKCKIGYMPESAPIYPEMMVYDYLDYLARLREIPSEKVIPRIKEMSDLCGLKSVMHKNISQISKGYRQRVGLAHALIGDPDILVLDEPTAGLDPNQIVEIRKLIKKVGKEKTVILCSHILSEVEATCDRIIIINQGRIVADDVKENITSQSQDKKVIFLDFQEPKDIRVIEEELSRLPFDVVVSKNETENKTDRLFSLKLEYRGEVDRRLEIMNYIIEKKYPLISFYQERRSLETVFRDLTLNTTISLNDSMALDGSSQVSGPETETIARDD